MNLTKIKVILGACGIHLCIGSVYAWSVWVHPIMDKLGSTLSETTFTFSLAILFLGLSAGFLGRKVLEWGSVKTGYLSTLCFTGGLVGTSVAIELNSLSLLYLSYGVIGGIGLGLGYIAPVGILLKTFPKNMGFAGGCAVMAFGFASLIAGPLISRLISIFDLHEVLIILAVIYAIVMLISSSLLKVEGISQHIQKRVSISKEVSTKEFKLLWVMFFINITCGIALLAVAAPILQSYKLDPLTAATWVGWAGLCNGAGRIVFASISDYIGRPTTYLTIFGIEGTLFMLLAIVSTFISDYNLLIFQISLLTITACYGAGFSCMPAFLADIFGTEKLSAIHGRILTAWGFAGIVGPLTIAWVYELTNTHTVTFILFSILFLSNIFMMSLSRKFY